MVNGGSEHLDMMLGMLVVIGPQWLSDCPPFLSCMCLGIMFLVDGCLKKDDGERLTAGMNTGTSAAHTYLLFACAPPPKERVRISWHIPTVPHSPFFGEALIPRPPYMSHHHF